MPPPPWQILDPPLTTFNALGDPVSAVQKSMYTLRYKVFREGSLVRRIGLAYYKSLTVKLAATFVVIS